MTTSRRVAHAQQLRLQVRIAGVDLALIDDIGAAGLQHGHVGIDRCRAVARSVADDGDLLDLHHPQHVAVRRGAICWLVGALRKQSGYFFGSVRESTKHG